MKRGVAENELRKIAELRKNVMDNVAKVFYGDANQLLEAENALKGANPNIAGLDKNEDNLINMNEEKQKYFNMHTFYPNS